MSWAGAIIRLEGAQAASKADSPLNGDASGWMCPRGRCVSSLLSGFSPGYGPGPGARSQLGNQLRPDRDHPDEQCNRRQRRRFFHKNLQHARLLTMEHKKNIVPILFSEVKRVVGQFEK